MELRENTQICGFNKYAQNLKNERVIIDKTNGTYIKVQNPNESTTVEREKITEYR
jgi:hypothetical protein